MLLRKYHRQLLVHVTIHVFACWFLADGAIVDDSITTYACENDRLVLECQHGEVIRILRANYGRFTIAVCNQHGQTDGWNLLCMSPKARDIISERCDGRRECSMDVSNDVFGEPCYLTSKYAEVQYSCNRAPHRNSSIQSAMLLMPGVHKQMPLNGSPKPPEITSATAISPNQISINWTQPETPTPVHTTAVYYVQKTATGVIRSLVRYVYSHNSVVIEPLTPNTTYIIFLKSFNIFGPSVTSQNVSITTPPADEKNSGLKTPGLKTITTSPGLTRNIYNSITSPALTFPFDLTISSSTTALKTDSTQLKQKNTPQVIDNITIDVSPYQVSNGTKVHEVVKGVGKFCEQSELNGLLWPRTKYGTLAESTCPKNLKGRAKWFCLKSGWDRSGPDLSNCISDWMENIEQRLGKGQESPGTTVVLVKEAMKNKEFTPGDLKTASTKLLPLLSQEFQQDSPFELIDKKRQKMKTFKEAFISVSSNLLSKKNTQSWQHLEKQDREMAATSLITAVEDTGFHIASLLDVGSSEVTVEANLILQVNVIDTQHNTADITFSSKMDLWEGNSDTITIKSSSLRTASSNGKVNAVFTMYNNLEYLMQPQSNSISSKPSTSYPSDTYDNYSEEVILDESSVDEVESSPQQVINTNIIAASLNGKQRRRLPSPVTFTLQHLQPVNETKPVCSFWEMDTRYQTNRWSQEGCRLVATNKTHTTCECDHLTNFAVLMDVTGIKLSQSNILALRVITYVGCVISVICLFLSWLTFTVFKNLQCDRNTIHKNLVFCLLMAEILFLCGIAQTDSQILCSIIACTLHYLFLGAFAWMCLEGIQLYVMLVEVFEQEKSRVHLYYIFGYGVPAVIITVSAGIYHEGYGTDRHCWLTTENYFIWSFVGPALAVMMINIVMLSIAIYIMCRHTNMSAAMRERSKGTKFRAWLKGAIVLVVLLGVTWLLGILYLNEESVVMAYFFTILNSLQGLFIFIFHCLKNEKVQKEYRKFARRTPWLPNCIRVNYGGYTGVASSSPNGSSSSGNILSKIFGQKNRNSAASTNSSAKPFLSKNPQSSGTENSSSKDSSNVPSSLNGYIYNPNYSTSGSVKDPTLNSNGVSNIAVNWQANLANNYERVDDFALNLSENVDCSVVDSEYISEYCKHNMQISKEEHRYSTGSEDSDSRKPAIKYNQEVDNLSTLSVASSSKKPASSLSSIETLNDIHGPRINNDTQGEKQKRGEDKDPHLNLHQYLISGPRINNSNNNNDFQNINEKSKSENIVNSMNKFNKPVPSLSSIPEAHTSPQHSSAPNLQGKLNFTDRMYESSTSNSTKNISNIQDNCEPVYAEVLDSPSSTKSSLPNLHVLNIDCDDSKDFNAPIAKHSSEKNLHFSPFKFSQNQN